MCGFVKKAIGGSAKAPQAVTYAPAATVMNSDVADTSAQGAANERERKKRGFNSTRSGMENILAAVGTKKDTLG